MSVSKRFTKLIIIYSLLGSLPVYANGILRDGYGTKSMSTGGASLALPVNPLSAMNVNPAALGQFQHNTLELGVVVGILDAVFDNSVSADNDADHGPGFFPEAAYVHTYNDWSFGVSINPVTALVADWKFADPVGVLGSYGVRTHKSSILALRGALGAGYQMTPRLALGASVGLLYNRNRLKSPYIFQSHPLLGPAGLGGANVLVNLDTDGFGVNGVLSADFQLTNNLQMALSYTTPSYFDSEGTLRGFGNGVGAFSYDAEVDTELPQIFSAGLRWQAQDALRLGLQLDWINWEDAFDRLPVHLTNGNNTILNGLTGSNRIDDTTQLNWSDELTIRLGMLYKWTDQWQIHAGYSYGGNPVPDGTLTPMTAAITEHLISLGAGYQAGGYELDIAYQWELPNEERVRFSQLAGSGEYDNTRTDVSIHWLSFGITFTGPF